jgi:hypothetical protein
VGVAQIEVKPTAEDEERFAFRVTVRGTSAGPSRHGVTLSRDDHRRLSRPDEPPERFVERCFRFLLQREPIDSIMASFDVSVIGRYFPEFEGEIASRPPPG